MMIGLIEAEKPLFLIFPFLIKVIWAFFQDGGQTVHYRGKDYKDNI